MRIRAVLVFILAVTLCGCASQVRTTVSTFRAVDTLPANGSIRVSPLPETHHDELEFLYFGEKLAAKLNGLGYEVVETGDADLIAYLDFSSVRQKKDHKNATHFYSSLGYRYRHGSVVVVDGDHEEYEYVRRVQVRIVKPAGDGEENLLNVAAVSAGACSYLASVYDEMLASIFANLYKENGSVVTVSEKASRSCTE